MLFKLIAALILVASVSSYANAHPSSGQAFSGAGTVSCGSYLEHRESNANMFVSWAQGFLSGANMANHVIAKKEFVLLPDAASIKTKLDTYCKDNPKESPVQGIMQLFWELQNRAKSTT